MATPAPRPRVAALTLLLAVAAALACAPRAAAANTYATAITASTYARRPVTIDLGPAKMTPAGDILRPSVNTAGLKYGSMVKVTDYSYTYTPNPAAVLPAGCTDACVYTISDGASVTETAPITITIGERGTMSWLVLLSQQHTLPDSRQTLTPGQPLIRSGQHQAVRIRHQAVYKCKQSRVEINIRHGG